MRKIIVLAFLFSFFMSCAMEPKNKNDETIVISAYELGTSIKLNAQIYIVNADVSESGIGNTPFQTTLYYNTITLKAYCYGYQTTTYITEVQNMNISIPMKKL